jgi:hypothetical protein
MGRRDFMRISLIAGGTFAAMSMNPKKSPQPFYSAPAVDTRVTILKYFVCHLGDHDWVLTVPAAKWLIPEMEKIAMKEYGMTEADLRGKKFNAFRNYVFSQASIMNLYQILNSRGEAALIKVTKDLVAA